MMWVGQNRYTVNGVEKQMDVAYFIQNGRTFVPIRFVAEEFGLEADWGPQDDLTEWVTLEKQGQFIKIEIGSPTIKITENGVERTVTADVAAQISQDRTYLPLRALGETLGAEFDRGPREARTVWVSFTLP